MILFILQLFNLVHHNCFAFSNPLPMAIYTAFNSRCDFLSLDGAAVNSKLTACTSSVERMCNNSGQLLKDSLLYTKPRGHTLEIVSC